MENESNSLLEVKDLEIRFPIRRGVFKRTVGWVRAVDGVSFSIRRGETLGLVGESGCGKTTTLRAIVRAIEPTGGDVRFTSQGNGSSSNITELESGGLRDIRQQIRVIFQDPLSSLNPRFRVRDIIAEPLKAYHLLKGRSEIDAKIERIMESVRLDKTYLHRYPFAMSGGQMQRIGIGRALATDPQLLLADEPTSALDVSVQAQILNLLLDLQREMNLSILFVTHDLSVIRHVSDRIAVMYLGKIVELGETNAVFKQPLHPYTEALLSAIPEPNPHLQSRRIILKGDIPGATDRPLGCAFHPRCQYAQDICRVETPKLLPSKTEGHQMACHFPLS